jgi:hypothetical protein
MPRRGGRHQPQGDVVGRFTSGGNTRGFVYTDSGFTEIGTFGGQNSMAVAINDAGQIAATACRGGVFSDCHAVRLDLLSPVPEPGGWAMLALGIGAIGLRGASRLRRPC